MSEARAWRTFRELFIPIVFLNEKVLQKSSSDVILSVLNDVINTQCSRHKLNQVLIFYQISSDIYSRK